MTGLDALQTPALLIDLDQVRANVTRMTNSVGGDLTRWRPHVKTAKIPEVLDLVLAAGVRSFKCATTREADVLLRRAREPIDLLVAIAHHGNNRIRVGELADDYPQHRVSLLTEDPEHARTTPAALSLFVDLNPGYHRTGIPLSDRERLAATVAACGDRLRGLHFYDGHLHDGTALERTERCAEIYSTFLGLVDGLALDDPELITSGTPTFPMALAYPGFVGRRHTVSPGTVVYWDDRSSELAIDGFAPAATVLATVISHPAHDRITCDAGSKAIDAAAGDPCALIFV